MGRINFVTVFLNEYANPVGMDVDGQWWLWSKASSRWEKGVWGNGELMNTPTVNT